MNAPTTLTPGEIWERQRQRREHLAAVPPAIVAARAALEDLHGETIEPTMPVRCIFNTGHLRTLLAEVERLQGEVGRLRQDLRDEQREAQYSARAAYADGHHNAMDEGRGY